MRLKRILWFFWAWELLWWSFQSFEVVKISRHGIVSIFRLLRLITLWMRRLCSNFYSMVFITVWMSVKYKWNSKLCSIIDECLLKLIVISGHSRFQDFIFSMILFLFFQVSFNFGLYLWRFAFPAFSPVIIYINGIFSLALSIQSEVSDQFL